MSTQTSRPALRWLAPAGVALAIVAGGVGIGAVTSAADPSLPTRSAAQLLVDLQTASLDGMSGTVVMRANLGLPPLPALTGGDGTDLRTLLAGTHTLRVWYSGPDKVRLALLDTLGETDLIRNGRDLWTWSSRKNTATHQTLPDGMASLPNLAVPGLTPDQVAKAALTAIEPSTRVAVDGTAQVAGRDAYELVLSPRDDASLIASVRLAIDATEHVPLRVLVLARGVETPAIEVAFTRVSFARPDPDQFVFNPPPGATVEEAGERDRDADREGAGEDGKPGQNPAKDGDGDGDRSATVGRGWTTVLVVRPGGEGLPKELTGILETLPRAAGGRVLTGTLFSVLFTDDGRILVGAVTPARLAQAAADPAARLAG